MVKILIEIESPDCCFVNDFGCFLSLVRDLKVISDKVPSWMESLKDHAKMVVSLKECRSQSYELARIGVDRQILDLEHLSQYTSEDQALERELLGLFRLQARQQLASVLEAQDKADWVMAVHTLKGSARGIGAQQVALLSQQLEQVGFDGVAADKQALTGQLKTAVEACIDCIEGFVSA